MKQDDYSCTIVLYIIEIYLKSRLEMLLPKKKKKKEGEGCVHKVDVGNLFTKYTRIESP